MWIYVKQQKNLKQYTYLLTIPFLTGTLLLDVLAAKDMLPDILKVKTKDILIYQIISCYLCVSCLNFNEFRLNVFFFSPLTLAAAVIVSHEQKSWSKFIFNLLTPQVQLDNHLNEAQFQVSSNFLVMSTIGFIFVINCTGYLRQLDVCFLHCEISKSGKQDDQFKTYLKNNTDGVIVYAIGEYNTTNEVNKVEIKMVNDVFTKLTDIKE